MNALFLNGRRALVLIGMTVISPHVYADYVWMKPVGCATVIDIVKVDQEPQFYFGNKQLAIAELERSRKLKPPKAYGGADIFTQIASGIPVIGPFLAVPVGIVSETILNGVVNTYRENTIPTPVVDTKWIAYKLTIKPDYGDQFTVIYGVNNPSLANNDRIQILKTESDDIVNLSFGIRFAGLFTSKYIIPQESKFNAENQKNYLRNCYGDDPQKYEAIFYKDGKLFSESLPNDLINY